MGLLVVLGMSYGALLLLWLLTALPALLAAIPGEFSPAAMVVPWLVAVVGWLAVPITCVIALDALADGVLDGRSLLPPLAFGVVLAGVGLGAVIVGVDGALRRRRDGTTTKSEPVESSVGVPTPWREHGPLPVRGVRALGFADDPATGRELMLVITRQGSGVFDTTDGTRLARDDDPDRGLEHLVTGAVSRYPGIGPLADRSVPVVGPELGTLSLRAPGWRADVVAGDREGRLVLHRDDPDDRDELPGGPWTVCALPSRIDLAGFSPSGRTLVAVFDAALWWCTRPGS